MIRDAAVYMLNKLVMEPAGWESFTNGYELDDEAWIADVPVGPGVYLLYTPGHFFRAARRWHLSALHRQGNKNRWPPPSAARALEIHS